MKSACAALASLLCLAAATASAYPLDAWQETHIDRLLAFDLAREPLVRSGGLLPGALWSVQEVRLRLAGLPFRPPAPDPVFAAQIRELLGADANAYGVAVLDLSNPERPLYAEVNPSYRQIPGSIGKIVIALAWFQALADLYPHDVAARDRMLRDTFVTADAFIENDEHVVPVWHPGDPRVLRRPIQIGDRVNLWTWLDWMLSASSNAAGSEMLSELLVLRHFGRAYPVSPEEKQAFFAHTPAGTLGSMLAESVTRPLRRSGLDPGDLNQASFFTRYGKAHVPGSGSTATPRGLLAYLVHMEQGRLVDPWSSLQIKRLLYLTDVRIRYASQPALDDSAVYFKSGSLYACRPERGFACAKYHGNVKNYMNSIAVVESEEDGKSLQYIVVVLSNVLRKDSTDMHRHLALRIHQLVEANHGVRPRPMLTPDLTPSPQTLHAPVPAAGTPEVEPLHRDDVPGAGSRPDGDEEN
jgi:hypothetical protein